MWVILRVVSWDHEFTRYQKAMNQPGFHSTKPLVFVVVSPKFRHKTNDVVDNCCRQHRRKKNEKN